jgi:hypothetical protein
MKRAASVILVLATFPAALAMETTSAPIPALRGIKKVNVHVSPLCSFVDFTHAATVIEADVRKALVARGIEVVTAEHDPDRPTLGFIIQCEDIRWEGGRPVLGEAPSAMLPEGAGAPFIYVISARLSRRVALPGNDTIQSDADVWSLDGRMRTLSKRPFVRLRDDILWATDAFIGEWEKARVTAGR